MTTSHSLIVRAVPAAMEQLRKSRILLAEYMQDRRAFSVGVARGTLGGAERVGQERALRIASMALVSSYRKAAELLRKRQMSDDVVQTLHELGNLQWLEGDAAGAQLSWSDAVDTAFQYVYAIKNWQKCVETNVAPPPDSRRSEIMLLIIVILAKHARLTMPKDATAHLHAALFASGILEAVVSTALPHPTQRLGFALDKYRMREIFFGLRESSFLMTPNSVHGGVDGATFLSALSFFHSTLLAADYQPARCLPMCSLYNYIATDVCRSRQHSIAGRLMMARALLRCRSLTHAWLALHAVANDYDKPRALLAGDVLDRAIVEVPDTSGATPFNPYRVDQVPFTEENKKSIEQLQAFALGASGEAGDHNGFMFQFLQAEFLLCVCSYARVFSKLSDPEEADRSAWLAKGEERLKALWKEVTGNDDDVEAWMAGGQPPAESGVVAPARELNEADSELCVDIRLLRAKSFELRGDLPRAVSEVLHGMHFLRLLATTGTRSAKDCGVGGQGAEGFLRTHAGMKTWALLRRRMVHLLTAQGRLKAVDAHIEQGLLDCQKANDDITRIELLAAKARVDTLRGRILEFRGPRREGALPAAETCLSVATKRMPVPPPSAVIARVVLGLLTEQNVALVKAGNDGDRPAAVADQVKQVIDSYGRDDDPSESLILEAQGSIIVSPIAKDMAAARGKKGAGKPRLPPPYVERQTELAEMMRQCVEDLDRHLEVQGFELVPQCMNSLHHIGEAHVVEQPDYKLLAPLKPEFSERLASDCREPPNIYLELMPLRLHCELRLARLRLDLGGMEEALRLLRDAETRISRCVHVLPWLYVQLSTQKLQWRRLHHRHGLMKPTPSADMPNDDKFRDPKAFLHGCCPPTDSPLYRTFVTRARVPALTPDSQWDPPPVASEDGLAGYLEELLGVLRVARQEGGNDPLQLMALLREGLEEVLMKCCGFVAQRRLELLCLIEST